MSSMEWLGSRTDMGSLWEVVHVWCERDCVAFKRKGFVKSRPLLELLKVRASEIHDRRATPLAIH